MREGVFIKRITYFNFNLLTKFLSLLMIIPVYLSEVLRSQVVIIYGAHIIGYQAIIYLCKLFGRKVIFRSLLLGSDDMASIFKKKSVCRKAFYRHMFRRLDLYFAINPVFDTRFRSQMGTGIDSITCPQGVDTDSFRPADSTTGMNLRNHLGINHNGFVIMSVGFLIDRKGFTEVFNILGEFTFDFRYMIIGEYLFPRGHFLSGKKEEAAIIHNEGISVLGERLILTGPVDHIAEYYQAADLVLINSTREGLPNTLLEAMACGRAVLIKSLPGVDYIIRHRENGIIYKDSNEMKEWFYRLYQEPGLRMDLGQKARDFAESKATFRQAWNQIESFL